MLWLRGLGQVEIALDEFIIDWHLSSIDNERETAESIIRIVKKKCHRLVFDHAYLDRFRSKIRDIERQRKKDTYVAIVLARRFGRLLYNSAKVRVCKGENVNELDSIGDDFDKLVIKSALCIQNVKKLFVTTDLELIEQASALGKYGIEGVTPEKAEKILMESPGSL